MHPPADTQACFPPTHPQHRDTLPGNSNLDANISNSSTPGQFPSCLGVNMMACSRVFAPRCTENKKQCSRHLQCEVPSSVCLISRPKMIKWQKWEINPRGDKPTGGGGAKCCGDIWPRLPIPHYHQVLALKGLRTKIFVVSVDVYGRGEHLLVHVDPRMFFKQNHRTPTPLGAEPKLEGRKDKLLSPQEQYWQSGMKLSWAEKGRQFTSPACQTVYKLSVSNQGSWQWIRLVLLSSWQPLHYAYGCAKRKRPPSVRVMLTSQVKPNIKKERSKLRTFLCCSLNIRRRVVWRPTERFPCTSRTTLQVSVEARGLHASSGLPGNRSYLPVEWPIYLFFRVQLSLINEHGDKRRCPWFTGSSQGLDNAR